MRIQLSVDMVAGDMGKNILVAPFIRPIGREGVGYN